MTKRCKMTRGMLIGVLAVPLLGFGEWVKIDDFQSFSPGALPKQANGWTTADERASQLTVCADTLSAGNQCLRLHRKDGTNAREHDILYQAGAVNIAPGKKGTVFLRFLVESGLDGVLGSTRGEKPVQPVRILFSLTEQNLHAGNPRKGVSVTGLNAGLQGFGAKRGDGSMPIARNRWYRLWLVVDNSADLSGGASKGFIMEEGGKGQPVPVSGSLSAKADYQPGILGSVGIIKVRDSALTDVLVDDFYVDNSGENMSDPLTSGAVMGWREKLLEEAKPYAHLLKKPDTRDEAEKQAAKLVEAMNPAERFSLVCGDGHLGLPAFMRLGIPGINFTDASSGINNGNGPVGSRHARTVAHPCTLLLAATWNTELAKDYGRAIGEECRSGGTHVLLGPGMNLYRVSAGGRNFEYMGEDPVLTGKLVANYVRGLQSAGTGATLKHFIANEIEFHRRGSNSQMDERTLHEVYMEPFRKGIEAGAFAVMTSYNQLNGEWAGQSCFVNTHLLRDTLSFRGISMTDWISTYDGVKLAQSGTDLEMPGGGALKKDREKVFGTPDIDRMARRIVAACIFAGFYERPQKDEHLEKNRPEWERTAMRVNQEGIVLLKNGGALPMARQQAGRKILVAGNFAQRAELAGDGSGHVKGYNLKTYAQILKEYFADAEVSCVEKPEDAQIRNAEWVVLFAGFAGEGEGRDTRFILSDEELISKCAELNPKTVVCVTSGCGVRMEWADKAAAILYGMFGGQAGPGALMEILTGEVSPSGRLPFTIEKRIEDSPGFAVLDPKPDKERPYAADYIADYVKGEYYVSEDKKNYFVHNVNYAEGVFIGHRWYESKNIPVRFPFGFGLGYTTFAYENLKVDVKGQTVRLSFTLKNTGKRSGTEVAQVYVSDKVSSVPRPPQELKAFQKVRLGAGKSKRVELELGPEAFRFWNPATKQWTVEPGEFEIRVGANSADIRLKETVRLASQ